MATIDWTPVDEALAESTDAGAKLAVVESGKILAAALREAHVAGIRLSEQVAAAQHVLTRPKDVTATCALLDQLRFGTSPALRPEAAKSHIQTIKQAVADLSAAAESRDSAKTRFKLGVGMLRGKQRLLLQALGAVASLFVVILFLADTGPGQAMVEGIVGIVHFFVRWIVGLVALVVILTVAVGATALYLDRRTSGSLKEEDKH